MHRIAERLAQQAGHFPLGVLRHRRDRLAHAADAAFRIGEGAVLFQERGAGQEHMRVSRGLVQEKVVHDDAFHRFERARHVVRVGIGLRDVFALHVQRHEGMVVRGVEHVGDAQARLRVQLHAPGRLEQRPRRFVRNVAIAGIFVRERAHVARALHVVLAAQGIHADAVASDIARRHGEIGHADDHRRTLAVLGDAEPVIDRAVAGGRVKPRRLANFLRRHAGDFFHRFGRILGPQDEVAPVLEVLYVAAFANEFLVDQAFLRDGVGNRVDHRHVCARLQRQMVRGLDMGHAHQIDAARIDHDHFRAFANAPLHARSEHGMGIGRIGADNHDDVGIPHRIEILRACRGAVCRLQAIAGRRMADARAGVDIVVAEGRADHLLHHESFFVGAARAGDAADGAAAIFLLDAAEFGGDMGDGFVPCRLAPGILDGGAGSSAW